MITASETQVNRRARWWGPVIYFSVMTVFMTWPLVRYMGHSIVGHIGDNVYFIWLFGWFRQALFELHISPLTMPFLNYPEGWSLAHTELSSALVVLGLPISFVGGNVLAYNLIMLLSFVLSGLGVYGWVYSMTKNCAASLIAGTIFAFVPYRMAHFLAGHMNLAGTQWLPLYFWGLFDLLQIRERNNRPAVLAALSLGLIALTSQYYLYITSLASALILILTPFWLERRQFLNSEFWKRIGVFLVIALPLVLAAVAPFLQLDLQGGLPARNIEALRGASASLNEILLPASDHFLWGEWVSEHFDTSRWVEGSLYPGLIACLLAGVSLLFAGRLMPHRRRIYVLTILTIVFFILTLGTDLHWMGRPRPIGVPQFLQPFLHTKLLTIWLPGYYLFSWLPFYAKMRVFKRFAVIALLSISVMAGLGSAWLLQKKKPFWRGTFAVGLLGLIILDFYPGPYGTFTRIAPRPVDLWLAAQPGQGALAQFPFIQEEDQDQIYYTLFHGKPFLGGFFNAFPTPQYQRIKPILDQFPTPESIALLRGLGVQYVIVDSTQYENFSQTATTIEASGLNFLTVMDSQYVYELSR